MQVTLALWTASLLSTHRAWRTLWRTELQEADTVCRYGTCWAAWTWELSRQDHIPVQLFCEETLQSRASLAGARNMDVKANSPCYSQADGVVRFWGPEESCEWKSCEVSSFALCTKELWVLDNSPGTPLPIEDHITSDLETQDLQSLFRIPFI